MKTINMAGKISSVASYCTSGSLICWGSLMDKIHHLDWNNIAVMGGFVIGIATYLTNAYYRRVTYIAYNKALERGYVTPPPQED